MNARHDTGCRGRLGKPRDPVFESRERQIAVEPSLRRYATWLMIASPISRAVAEKRSRVAVGIITRIDDRSFECRLESHDFFEELGALTQLESGSSRVRDRSGDLTFAAPTTICRDTKYGTIARITFEKSTSRLTR